ncbi:hypothetical protein [Chitinilyticum litopenaei]|uniref:hypothetical protein n=1 Tax=Chitinilyticum litopenaei TaxID=1121276 RepID=UPI0005BA39C7|nr:hypothetical protein [Chitinilyticum litopenaei]
MIAMIASVAVIYANRSGQAFQANSVSAYQHAMAQQAAETGLTNFVRRVELDIVAMDGGAAAGTILAKAAPSGGAAACVPNTSIFPYEFTGTYSASKTSFDAGKYYTGAVTLLAKPAEVPTSTSIDPKLAWRVKGRIDGSYLHITAEGCAGNTQTGHDICKDATTKAVARRSMKIAGKFSAGGSAITLGKYADANATLDVTATALTNLPECAVTYGESFNKIASADHKYRCAGQPGGFASGTPGCPPSADSSLQTDMFQRFFGGSVKADVVALANKVANSCTGNLNIAALPTVRPVATGKSPIIVINGDLNSCNIVNGPANAIYIHQGNVNGSVNVMSGGFFYTNNVLQNGAIYIVDGMLAVEGVWDSATGAASTNTPGSNDKSDATSGTADATNHAAFGALTIVYKNGINFNPELPNSSGSNNGSWIDF